MHFTVQIVLWTVLSGTPGISASQTTATRKAAVTPSAAEPWVGAYEAEVSYGTDLVQEAVALCFEIQNQMAVAKGDTSLGAKLDTSAAGVGSSGVAVVKGDQTPVTAADFAIQGFISDALKEAFPNDLFMGEEDGAELRADPALCGQALDLARQLRANFAQRPKQAGAENGVLSEASFLVAVDRGVEPPKGDNDGEEPARSAAGASGSWIRSMGPRASSRASSVLLDWPCAMRGAGRPCAR
mmetsp:Transcript_9391/g.21265  ORF Transcript_9391/g.21265 Transcript_9391/m.21265 type:complete len:241 (-) Transcript_9391:349-1071(-)